MEVNGKNNKVLEMAKTSGLLDKLRRNNTNMNTNNMSIFSFTRRDHLANESVQVEQTAKRHVECSFTQSGISTGLQRMIKNFERHLNRLNRMGNKEDVLYPLYGDLFALVVDHENALTEKSMICSDSTALTFNNTMCSNCSFRSTPNVCKPSTVTSIADNASGKTAVTGGLNTATSQRKFPNVTNNELLRFPIAFDNYLNLNVDKQRESYAGLFEEDSTGSSSPVLRGGRVGGGGGGAGGTSSCTNNRQSRQRNGGFQSSNGSGEAKYLTTSVKRNFQETKELKNWSLKKKPGSMGLELFGCCVLPHGRATSNSCHGIVYARVSNKLVKTNKGSFLLHGPIIKKDLPGDVVEIFQNGFPPRWRRAILNSSWNE